MKTNRLRVGYVVAIVLSACFANNETTQAALTTNFWSVLDGRWETSTNWSAGAPSITQAYVYLANVSINQPGITTTIDAATAGSSPSTMTISNLVIGDATLLAFHTLIVSNTGTVALQVLNSVMVTNRGSIYLTNSTMRIVGPLTSSPSKIALGIEGSVTVDAGATLIAQSSTSLITYAEAVGVNGSGTLVITGGTNLVGISNMVLGDGFGSFGNVIITGGALLVTNMLDGFGSGIDIGNNGGGSLSQSNGFVMALSESMGQGTLTVAAGTHLTGSLDIDGGFKATGTVWVTGGELLVTNGVSAEGTVLGTDTSGSTGIMTVSNGIFATTWLVLGFNAGDVGVLTVVGGTASISSNLTIANSLAGTGTVTVTGGQLIVTNNETDVGYSGVGQMTISGGVVLSSNMVVGNFGGSRGTFTMAGGTNTLSAGVTIGNLANATGTVWVTGGQLDTGIQSIIVGDSGVGQMTVSNGTVLAAQLAVAFGQNSRGTFTSAGGVVTPSVLEVGLNTATGTVWVTGGQLSPYLAQIGRSGRGQVTVSNGIVEVGSSMSIGVGIAPGFSQGSLTVVGGSVAVTNFSGTGVLIVGQADTGNYIQNGGTVTVDNLLVTNLANSVFTFNGGTFQTKATTVSNTLQCTVGNGATAATYHLVGGIHSFNNGLRVRNNATLSGCGTINGNVLIDSGGTVVADCGGSLTFNGSVTNDGTMQAINGSVLEAYGTVVNNGLIDITGGTTNFHGTFVNNGSIVGGPVPAFQITSILHQGSNIFISWQTSIGATDALQETSGGPDGSYNTNGFTDIFIATNTVTTTTNYFDNSAATNTPARYYRVRLVP